MIEDKEQKQFENEDSINLSVDDLDRVLSDNSIDEVPMIDLDMNFDSAENESDTNELSYDSKSETDIQDDMPLVSLESEDSEEEIIKIDEDLIPEIEAELDGIFPYEEESEHGLLSEDNKDTNYNSVGAIENNLGMRFNDDITHDKEMRVVLSADDETEEDETLTLDTHNFSKSLQEMEGDTEEFHAKTTDINDDSVSDEFKEDDYENKDSDDETIKIDIEALQKDLLDLEEAAERLSGNKYHENDDDELIALSNDALEALGDLEVNTLNDNTNDEIEVDNSIEEDLANIDNIEPSSNFFDDVNLEVSEEDLEELEELASYEDLFNENTEIIKVTGRKLKEILGNDGHLKDSLGLTDANSLDQDDLSRIEENTGGFFSGDESISLSLDELNLLENQIEESGTLNDEETESKVLPIEADTVYEFSEENSDGESETKEESIIVDTSNILRYLEEHDKPLVETDNEAIISDEDVKEINGETSASYDYGISSEDAKEIADISLDDFEPVFSDSQQQEYEKGTRQNIDDDKSYAESKDNIDAAEIETSLTPNFDGGSYGEYIEESQSDFDGAISQEDIDKAVVSYQEDEDEDSFERSASEDNLVDSVSIKESDDIKKLLAYLDNLLGDLPEDKIKEFAESKHYDIYAYLMKRFGV